VAENEDVNSLKRRSRRRLVGAIALVLLAVIVLPMVFDAEPRRTAPPVSVRIPAEDETGFTPKVTPKTPPVAAAAPSTPAPAPEKRATADKAAAPDKAATKPEERPAAKPAAKIVAKAAEKPAPLAPPAAAKAPAPGGAHFIVPVAALANPDKVRELTERLEAAKLPYYTEPVATAKGPVTRVRAGPFASRDAAERALQQLKDLGLKPGNVTTRG
jgi:DedD protein